MVDGVGGQHEQKSKWFKKAGNHTEQRDIDVTLYSHYFPPPLIMCKELMLSNEHQKDDGQTFFHPLFDHSLSLFTHQEQPKTHQHIMKLNTFILALTLAASAKVYAEVRRTWTPSTETHHLVNYYDLL